MALLIHVSKDVLYLRWNGFYILNGLSAYFGMTMTQF